MSEKPQTEVISSGVDALIARLRDEGVTILIVDQMANLEPSFDLLRERVFSHLNMVRSTMAVQLPAVGIRTANRGEKHRIP